MSLLVTDTIAAIATATGRGGVGIIRLSGPDAKRIGERISQKTLRPRYAHYGAFVDAQTQVLDEGITLFFPGPHSFTGEDVCELQGHGGPIILDGLLKTAIQLGARLARPGEFSERAFLNDKMDLTQAEAIADLIDATSEQAAKNALQSLQGVFSKKVHQLVQELITLRIYVEAAIDFPEEEIDFLSDGKVADDLDAIRASLQQVFQQAKQGALVRDGMRVVIAGRPNAGKSSLLNALSGRDSAIVTDIEGTTRDVLREHIHLDGMPLHIIDTAGLRDNPDAVEQIGIERALEEIKNADRVLLMLDSTQPHAHTPQQWWPEFLREQGIEWPREKLTVIRNKVDESGEAVGLQPSNSNQTNNAVIVKNNDNAQAINTITATVCIGLSAKTHDGIDALSEHLKEVMGYNASEGSFTARRRHLDALERAETYLQAGYEQLHGMAAGELLAEDLRQAQQCLSEITGEFTSDDLLGKIFSSFCIGK